MKNESLDSSVPYASESPLRGDDLLDSVLEAIRLICQQKGVAIIGRQCAEITTIDGVKLGELHYINEGRMGYAKTVYKRTTHPNP